MTKMEIARIATAILTENNSYNYGGSDENTEVSFTGYSTGFTGEYAYDLD